MKKFFDYFSKYYDMVFDAVCILNDDGALIYGNQTFCDLAKTSQIRIRNQQVQTENMNIKINGLSLIQYINETFDDLSQICAFECDSNLRGTGQIRVLRSEDEAIGNYTVFSLKDLSVEVHLQKSILYEVEIRDKKLEEIGQLVEVLQKIRLIDNPKDCIHEFAKHLINSNDVFMSLNTLNGEMKITTNNSVPKSYEENLINSSSAIEIEIYKIVNQYLNKNKVTKYSVIPFTASDSNSYYACFVPFDFVNSRFHVIFVFTSVVQKNKFNHQTAIILSEQLNVILNNLTLKEISITDGLTKLKNSMYFRDQLTKICMNTNQSQLILFDVDFFKKVNDTYGHPCGDAVLITIGDLLPKIFFEFSNQVANQSIIARVGGEEFAIIIPDQAVQFAFDLAEHIRKRIESTIVKYNDLEIKFTISLGVSSWKAAIEFSDAAVKQLYKDADDALYISKKSGRNQTQIKKVA